MEPGKVDPWYIFFPAKLIFLAKTAQQVKALSNATVSDVTPGGRAVIFQSS